MDETVGFFFFFLLLIDINRKKSKGTHIGEERQQQKMGPVQKMLDIKKRKLRYGGM